MEPINAMLGESAHVVALLYKSMCLCLPLKVYATHITNPWGFVVYVVQHFPKLFAHVAVWATGVDGESS